MVRVPYYGPTALHSFLPAKENNMKYPLFAAALLAFAVSACSDKKEEAPVTPANEMVAPAEEQAPAPVEEAPFAAPAEEAAEEAQPAEEAAPEPVADTSPAVPTPAN
jgi:hypothetical protein